MRINVCVDVPMGGTCYHEPDDPLERRGAPCNWLLKSARSGRMLCWLFDKPDVTGGYKCPDCERLSRLNKTGA